MKPYKYFQKDGKIFAFGPGDSQDHLIEPDMVQVPEASLFPPSPDHVWDGSAWVFDAALAAANMDKRRLAVWELIKAERSRREYGGVMVASNGNDYWWHNDPESQAKYLGMRVQYMIDANYVFPEFNSIANDLVQLNINLLNEIITKIDTHTKSVYAKAGFHKYHMMQAAVPEDYDYLSGWPQIYADTL